MVMDAASLQRGQYEPRQRNIYMMVNGIISHYHVTQCDLNKGLERENK